MHIAEFLKDRPQKDARNQTAKATVLKHALAASLILNLLLGGAFWHVASASHEQPAPSVADIPPSLFDFYTKALDSNRNTVALLQGVYCGNLSPDDCAKKLDKDAHAKGGDTLARYLSAREENATATPNK